MMVSKRNLLFHWLIFRFHVKLQGCNLSLQEAEVKLLAEAKVFEVEMRELKLRLADEEMKLALG